MEFLFAAAFPYFLLLYYKWISENTHSKRHKTTENIFSDKSACALLTTEKPTMFFVSWFIFALDFSVISRSFYNIMWVNSLLCFVIRERRIWTLKPENLHTVHFDLVLIKGNTVTKSCGSCIHDEPCGWNIWYVYFSVNEINQKTNIRMNDNHSILIKLWGSHYYHIFLFLLNIFPKNLF